MVAVDGGFGNFEPISRKLLKEVKSLMRQYDSEVRQLTDKKKTKSLYKDYNRKLIELLPDAEERLALARQVEKEIVTNKWLGCEEDNYWVEEDPDLYDMLHLSVTNPSHTTTRMTKPLPYNFSICMMTALMAGIRLQNVGPSIW